MASRSTSGSLARCRDCSPEGATHASPGQAQRSGAPPWVTGSQAINRALKGRHKGLAVWRSPLVGIVQHSRTPTTSHSTTSAAPRRGLTVLEVTLALLVLTVAITGLAQLLATAAAHRRTSDQRRLALQEVANQAERIALWPYDELTAEKLEGLAPSDDLLAAMPAAVLTAAVTDEAGPPAGKRVRLEVHWTNSAGAHVEPVGLTVWKHRREDQP